MTEQDGQADFEQTIAARLEAEVRRLRQRVASLRPQLAPVAPDCALGRQGRAETQAYQAVRARELEQIQADLRDTEAALGRLRSGRYGHCRHCGQPIARNRLLARPQSTLCSDCAH